MSLWIKVCPVKEFQGEVKLIYHEGKGIALFKTGENQFYAIEDECSHTTASLSEGTLKGYEIECPLHGARFDICTGKNLCFPAVSPVKSFPVKLENEVLYVEVE